MLGLAYFPGFWAPSGSSINPRRRYPPLGDFSPMEGTGKE